MIPQRDKGSRDKRGATLDDDVPLSPSSSKDILSGGQKDGRSVKLPTLYAPNNSIRDGGNVERPEVKRPDDPITDLDIIEELIDGFEGIKVIADNVGVSKSAMWRRLKQLGLKTKREYDRDYRRRALVYNDEYPRDQLTHAMDFYRMSNGSLQRKHHKRANVKFEGQSLLLGILSNIETKKIYFKTWLDDDETEMKAIDIIQTALDNDEEVVSIQMDRYLKNIVDKCAKMGITVACYGKSVNYPYNTHAEQPFTNISKVFYLQLGVGYGQITKTYFSDNPPERVRYYRKLLAQNQWDGLTANEALELFNSILEIHYNNNPIPFVKMRRRLRIQTIEAIESLPTKGIK